MGDRDDPDDVMETSLTLTIHYNKQWLNCVSAIGPMGSVCTKLHKCEQKDRTKTLAEFPDHILNDYE